MQSLRNGTNRTPAWLRLIVIALLTAWAMFAEVRATKAQTPSIPRHSVDWFNLPGAVTVAPGNSANHSEAGKPILATKVSKEVDKGRANLLAGQFDAARSEFEAAYKAAPGNPDVNYFLGLAFMAEKQFDRADTYLGRAYSIYPRDPLTPTAIGILRAMQSRFEDAISLLEAAIQLDKQMYLPHLILGEVFLAQKKFDDALTEGRIALKENKQDSRSKLVIGTALAALGQTKEAIKALQEFIDESPDDTTVKGVKQLMTMLQKSSTTPTSNTLP